MSAYLIPNSSDIDGLRAVAVLAVVLSTCDPQDFMVVSPGLISFS